MNLQGFAAGEEFADCSFGKFAEPRKVREGVPELEEPLLAPRTAFSRLSPFRRADLKGSSGSTLPVRRASDEWPLFAHSGRPGVRT